MAGKFMQYAADKDYSQFLQGKNSFPEIIQRPRAPITGRPYSVRENYERCVRGEKPYWMPAYGTESQVIWPDAIWEHPVPDNEDGYDWWGVYWEYVPSAGGAITKPGTRVISDFAKWKEAVEWPDLSIMDFETDGKKLSASLLPDMPHIYESTEGLFERLHEMMPFDETLLSFYEEPELLEEFFQKMADYKIDTCQKIFDYYGRVDGVLYHDDWGSEKGGFFSNKMFREQLMPATGRFLSYLKAQGKFIELHSCGNNTQYVPEMIEMGIDMWAPQERCNDAETLHRLYGKDITFAFSIKIDPTDTEETVRRKVDDFVDKFGENGRVMARIFTTPELKAIALDELYNYSLEYYNKLYNRA